VITSLEATHQYPDLDSENGIGSKKRAVPVAHDNGSRQPPPSSPLGGSRVVRARFSPWFQWSSRMKAVAHSRLGDEVARLNWITFELVPKTRTTLTG